MTEANLLLKDLWAEAHFRPNEYQEKAILHLDGPLYLTAGPGSGKTRVLLWRAVNLIVFHDIKPEEILLATFTEKAALQLREGLRALLSMVTNHNRKPYDLAKMYVGTMHSLCQRMLTDRRFSSNGQYRAAPNLMDELAQYLFLYKTSHWEQLTQLMGTGANETINRIFGRPSNSRHHAVSNCISMFNRFSEECLRPDDIHHIASGSDLSQLADLYQVYCQMLNADPLIHKTDFALLQQKALDLINSSNNSKLVFKHVIVDEYQDTNTIQESLYFSLAAGYQNLCVVGDDDQALYRFRGATVENFVEFPKRCMKNYGVEPRKIPLSINYRSRKKIVEFYTHFIGHPYCDWRKADQPDQYYRVVDKGILPFSNDEGPSVIASSPGKPDLVCDEIAEFVEKLIEAGKVENPNQIAFLYPSLKSVQVSRMISALEARGLKVYAPRAKTFLEVPESVDVFGLYLQVFGQPERGEWAAVDYQKFHDWMDAASARGQQMLSEDPQLNLYIQDRRQEIEDTVHDYQILKETAINHGWALTDEYDPAGMRAVLSAAPRLSKRASRGLNSNFLQHMIETSHRPLTLRYVINRCSSLDWNVLDLLYRLCGFKHLHSAFDLAETGEDEGPICNLSLLSQYLARFMDEYATILTGEFLEENFILTFFSSYLYALYRRGESEYEDAEDPFPRGRIPFLTIHQAKGLEFPVVVLGNPNKKDNQPQTIEKMINPILQREGEPLDHMAKFDVMRMFYVALSRAQNLLVLAHYQGAGQSIYPPFRDLINSLVSHIPQFDISLLPQAKIKTDELSRNYSYTSDYTLYKRCPRQYMIFRRYDFVPSRSQTMFFGSLVHQTMDDLHQFLIASRRNSHDAN